MPTTGPPPSSVGRPAEEDAGGVRERLEACRQGMAQLDLLRTKHLRLMQDLRSRLPRIPSCGGVRNREKRSESESAQRESVRSDDSGTVLTPPESWHDPNKEQEIESSQSQENCESQRSSISVDSGCSTDLTMSLSYTAFRKQSLDDPTIHATIQPRITPRARKALNQERRQELITADPHDLLSMTLKSATALPRCSRRPRSVCAFLESNDTSSFDSRSFSALTPPPNQRKFGCVSATLQVSSKKSATYFQRLPLPTQTVSPLTTYEPAKEFAGGQKTPPVKRRSIRPDDFGKECVYRAARVQTSRRPQSMYEYEDRSQAAIFSAQPARVLTKSPEIFVEDRSLSALIAHFESRSTLNRNQRPWHESRVL